MSRFTAKDFENHLRTLNQELLESGSNIQLHAGYAYGFTELHALYVNEVGKERTNCRLEVGTPRECAAKATAVVVKESGKLFPDYIAPTRKMAKRLLGFKLDFTDDFHAQSSQENQQLLTLWAKKTKYRMPKNANGNLARYFFYHLAKIKGV